MTRHKDLNVTTALDARRLRESLVQDVFVGCPDWMLWAGLAALHDFRPDLVQKKRTKAEAEQHVGWLNLHLWKLPRDDVYFARVCRLLKMYGVGSQWGHE